MKTLRFNTGWDDGSLDDLKIVELLKKHSLPGIFFLPDISEMNRDQVVELAKDFEIGGHTVFHPEDMKRLDDEELKYEVETNKFHLEHLIGKPVTKFAYPSGRYDKRVMEAVKNAGYERARTTLVLYGDMRQPYQVDTTIHCYPRREYKGRDWEVS